MARNSTLEKILNDVRVQARLSLNAAQNVQHRDHQVGLIRAEQERLWDDFAWPHLRVERFLPLQAGQRYYDPEAVQAEDGTPKGDLTVDRIELVEAKSDNLWLPLTNGINRRQYAVYDSAEDERAWPPRYWRLTEDDQIEIWPVPDQNAGAAQEGYLRLTGIRNLRPLVMDSDRADLDDQMLALYVAGGLLAEKKAADAELKMQKAARRYASLKGALSKSEGFQLFGVGQRPARRRPAIGHYKPPVS